ncbi:MAG: GAF domain-containing SpoIIE family protein phosphatase [Verrucomicrobiota bacterium]
MFQVFGTILILILSASLFIVATKLQRTLQVIHKRDDQINAYSKEKSLLFDFLHDLGEAFTENLDRQQLLDTILACSVNVTSARGGIIYLYKESKQALISESVVGVFPPPFPFPKEMEFKMASRDEYLESILRTEPLAISANNPLVDVFKERKVLYVKAEDKNRPFLSMEDENLNFRSLIVVPLHNKKECLGILAIANPTDRESFTEANLNLAKSIAHQAFFSLQSTTLYAELAEKQRMDFELNTAREIQTILLPEKCPVIPGYDITAISIPAQQVSGDYYDFIELDEDHLGIVIADVSGKGVPASLVMAICRSLIRFHSPTMNSPTETLKVVNRILYPDIREDMFITLAYFVLNHKTGVLTIAKAGHDAPLLCTDNFENIKTLQSPGIALGIDSGEVFDNVLQDFVVPLSTNDTVLVYTDGMNETVNSDGVEFGREPIKASLKAEAHRGTSPLLEDLVQRAIHFRGTEVQSDDITLVALQKK